jgi:hypothetical protein
MKIDKIKQFLPIITAFAKDKKIEYQHEDGTWREQDDLLFCNSITKYRIKPELEYVPFTFADAEQLIGKVIKDKNNEDARLVVAVSPFSIFAVRAITFEHLLRAYTFLDGTPCGKLKQ